MELRLSTLSFTHKSTVTLFLVLMGLSYVFAALNLQINTSTADGEPGTSVRDIQYTYRGNPDVTLLETMAKTSMNQYLPSDAALFDIEQWIADGKTEADYEGIRWIFDDNCVRCHSEGGEASHRLLTTYEEVSDAATPQLRSIGSLARFSHYHAFGMGLFCLALALIFSFTAFARPIRLIVCSLPFIAVLLDIGSWWLIRLISPVFAYVTLLGGALIGLSFALLILGSLYDMWWRRTA